MTEYPCPARHHPGTCDVPDNRHNSGFLPQYDKSNCDPEVIHKQPMKANYSRSAKTGLWQSCCCALASAADMDRKLAAMDRTDRQPTIT